MPELPEVETVRRSLLQLLPQKKITAVEVFKPQIIAAGGADLAQLVGREFVDFGRRGKYLLFGFGGDERLVVHLRMTGKLLYHAEALPREKHDHVRFAFADGSELVYNDIRAFGRFWLTDEQGLTEVSGLNSLGMEPLDDEFSAEYWRSRVAKRPRAMVKAALLDQHIVAGLGNIYADEVLFAAGVHPERPIGSLTAEEDSKLATAMQQILANAIANRGTTFRDYVDGNNEKGGYQNFLQVFQKKGQPCPNCGCTIERIKVAGRSSFFCPVCQHPPKSHE